MMLKLARVAAFAPSCTASCTVAPADPVEWRTIWVPAPLEVVATTAQLFIDRGKLIRGKPSAVSDGTDTPELPARSVGVESLYATFAKKRCA